MFVKLTLLTAFLVNGIEALSFRDCRTSKRLREIAEKFGLNTSNIHLTQTGQLQNTGL